MITFDPVLYSDAENRFLFEHLGEPPVVARRSIPTGVNPRAVVPALEQIYELVELAKHTGAEWVGIEACREAIQTWLAESEKWALDRRAGKPRFPSMSTYDSKGRAHWSGPGSDSGQVRTYFAKDGSRKPFAVELLPNVVEGWTPEWTKADEPKGGLKVDAEQRRIECLVCGHTESYNPDSRGSFNAARSRMSRHLKSATVDVDAHREVHTQEFT